MQPDATRKSRFRAATARECHLALRATKSNEDARSSGAGALARGPAPSPVHRPQAGRACAYSTERLPGIFTQLATEFPPPSCNACIGWRASSAQPDDPREGLRSEPNLVLCFQQKRIRKANFQSRGQPRGFMGGATERNVMQHEIVKWLVVAGAVGLSLRWRQPRTSSSGLQHNCACCVAFPKPPC